MKNLRIRGILLAIALLVAIILFAFLWLWRPMSPEKAPPRTTTTPIQTDPTTVHEDSGRANDTEAMPGSDSAARPSDKEAKDIHIVGVEWNQGTGIDIMKDGQWISARERSAPIIAGRPSLVRFFYAFDRGFVSRPVRAELSLMSRGKKTVRIDERSVSGLSDRDTLDGTFAFLLPEAAVAPDTRLGVRLLEADAAGSAIPDDLLRDLEVLDVSMGLTLRIIPATLRCADSPALTITDTMRAELEAELYNLFPVSKLNLQILPPVSITTEPCGDPAAVLSALARMRESEQVNPDELLHAIFPNAQRSLFPAGYDSGFSTLENEQPSMGDARVSYSVAFDKNWRHNVAHELGHSLGRPHTFIDEAYQPASGRACGRRDTVGFGVRRGPHGDSSVYAHAAFKDMNRALYPATDSLRSHPRCASFDGSRPTLNDFMSYAGPFWVSAYTYSRLAGVIAVMSRWREPSSRDRLEQFSSQFSLHGFGLRDGGPLHFVWLRGHPSKTSSTDSPQLATVIFRDASLPRLTLPVFNKRSLGGEYSGIVIPLPDGVFPADVDRVQYGAGRENSVWENE